MVNANISEADPRLGPTSGPAGGPPPLRFAIIGFHACYVYEGQVLMSPKLAGLLGI